MSEPQAFLSTVLYNPVTKQADQAVVVVQYGPKEARVRIELPPIPVDSPNLVDQLPQLLHELGGGQRRSQFAHENREFPGFQLVAVGARQHNQ